MFNEAISSKRVLVTGGSGFIGTNMVGALKLLGCSVVSVDRMAPRNSMQVDSHRAVDLLDERALTEVVRHFDPHIIFHLAARTDLDGTSAEDYVDNTLGTERLIGALPFARSLEYVAFASSRLVCAIGYVPRHEQDYCPTTAYGESKVKMEQIIRGSAIDVPWTIVRPTSIWGPWFDVPYRNFFDSIRRGVYVHPRGRKVQKSFGYVGNSVHQLIGLAMAGGSSLAGRSTYLCDYEPLELGSWARLIAENFGRRVHEVPMAALRGLALLGDAASAVGVKNAPLTSFRLDNLVSPMVHEVDRLRGIVGELPYSIEAGTVQTVAWMQGRR